ncbi:hypothetical protein KIN20_024941 [Parelaphostrongylus tenuis]|uniref:Uncharacterized protein n=1 Tax=Parelaphostrongylus tenuis TaxID=148309 RepID=A0AAD5QWL2_PARTN|nr:hypothetical protein KIN20_024941 [Parelaphostrongylus tenuis]
MSLALLTVFIGYSLAQIPYMCREIRLETKHEAERRQLYEYCTEICNEAESSMLPCSKCRIPYEEYGCLWQRDKVELSCVLECERLLPDLLAQMRCAKNCNTAKAFNILRSHY